MPTRVVLIAGIVVVVILCGIMPGCRSPQRIADQYYQEGLKYKEQREFREAAQQFRLAVTQSLRHVNAQTELGILLCRDRNYRQAIKHFLRAVEHDDSSYRAYAFMGYAYERLGRLDFSEQSYKRAIAQASRLIDVRLRLADVLELQDKRREAADVLEEILAMKPDIKGAEVIQPRASLLRQAESPEVHYEMADLYIRHGWIKRGILEYRKFEILDDEDPGTLVNFALFCLDRDRFATTAIYLQHVKQLGWTEQFEVRAGLGIAYEGLGEIEAAIREYRAALNIQPDWHDIHLKLAELLEQLDKPFEAADELEQLFRLVQQGDDRSNLRSDFPTTNQLWSEILRLRDETLKKAVVQLKHSGDYNLVEVVMNQNVSATLWIEKKAKYTILSEKLAQKLGIQITPHTSEFHFEFSGKSYTAPLVNLPSLRIGGLEARNIPALIWNLSEYPEIDGLLGMNFLKHFRVEINYADQLFVLTKLYS